MAFKMMKTMKNIRILGVVAAGICFAGLVSCGDDDNKDKNPSPQEAVIEGQVVSWNGTAADEAFPASAAVGLYAVEGEFSADAVRYIDNARMELSGGVFKTASGMQLKAAQGTLLAYYPYRAKLLAAGRTTVDVGVPADQSAAEDYTAADFMVASAGIEARHSGAVKMAFRRMFSKIDLEVTSAGSPVLGELKDAPVSIELCRTAQIDMVSGKVLTAADPAPMKFYGAWTEAETKLSGLSAIVVPQQVAAGDAVLSFLLGDTAVSCTLGGEVTFESGMQYTLSVRVGRDAGDYEVSVTVTEQEWLGGLDIEQTLDPSDDLLNPVFDIDGNSYPVTRIGTQYWMAENLRTTKLSDGTVLTNMSDAAQWSENSVAKTPAYCYQDNDAENAAQFGAIYNYYAVATNRLCPEGWHVPTKEEIEIMIDLLGGQNAAGDKLKSTSGWQGFNGKEDETYQGSNSSGFDGRPGGSREDDGTFYNFHKYGYWWSSTPLNDAQASGFYLYYSRPIVYQTTPQKRTGYSVRCIRYKN